MGFPRFSLPPCAALLLTSCGVPPTSAPASPAAQQAARAPASAVVIAPAPSASSAPAISSEPPLVEPVALPDPGCSFETGAGVLNGTLVLQLDGHRIGELDGDVTSLRAQVSRDAKRATVQVVTKDLELRADAHPPSLELALTASAAPIHEWIEVRSAQVSRCSNGKATLQFSLPSEVSPVGQPSPAEVDVRQLSLVRVGRHPSGRMEFLKTGARSPLRIAPGGKVVADVRGPDPVPAGEAMPLSSVTVLERKGAFARVLIEGSEADALGWINASALETASMLGLLGGGGSSEQGQRLQCPQGAKLLARAGSGTWLVGAVRPGGEVSVLPGRDGTLVVMLDPGPFSGGLGLSGVQRRQVPPGELFLPREEAQHCTVNPVAAKKR